MRCHAAIRTAILFIAVIFLTMPCVALAAEGVSDQEVEALESAIDQVMQKRIYQWRMPRPEIPENDDAPPGPITSFFKWIAEIVSGVFSYIGDLIDKFFKWLRSLGPERGHRRNGQPTNWVAPESLMLFALLALVAAAVIFGVRLYLKKPLKPQTEVVGTDAVATPDLADEKVSADELPTDRWLALAREMVEKGDLRLAMRAFYLATLAKLGDLELLTIAYFKSNLDYKRELDRRNHEKVDLRRAFIKSIHLFERTWYGLKAIDRSELDYFAALQEKIIRYAES